MKYIAPKYEMALVETEDILTASSGQAANYEIEQKDDGSGNVIMKAFDLFRQTTKPLRLAKSTNLILKICAF